MQPGQRSLQCPPWIVSQVRSACQWCQGCRKLATRGGWHAFRLHHPVRRLPSDVLGREIGAPIRGPDSLALERRELLKGFAGAAGVLLRSNLLAQGDEASLNVLAGVRLEPFVDPLPLPAVLRPATADSDSDHYRITISEFRQKLHRDLPPTILWGFEGCTPGPTIVGKRGRAVTVQWVNRLPERHRLAIGGERDRDGGHGGDAHRRQR